MSTAASQAARARAQRRNSVKAHRGISYRERADKSRNYQVSWKGRYVPDGGLPTLKEALAFQAT
jgi:hypothetical protein